MKLQNVSIAHMISKLSKRIQVAGEFARLDGPWASVVVYTVDINYVIIIFSKFLAQDNDFPAF